MVVLKPWTSRYSQGRRISDERLREGLPMADVAPINPPSLKPGQAVLRGRVDSIRRHEGRVYTRLILPAPDQYSSPSLVEIESTETLGERDQDVSVVVRVGGYRNDFRNKEGDTIRSARITLVAVS
jgi:hypothetical protein